MKKFIKNIKKNWKKLGKIKQNYMKDIIYTTITACLTYSCIYIMFDKKDGLFLILSYISMFMLGFNFYSFCLSYDKYYNKYVKHKKVKKE